MIQVAALFSLALLLLAVPIFLVFGIGSVIVAGDLLNLPWTQFLQTSVGAVSKYVLLAIPLFVFAGYVMVAGGMARRLVDLCVALVGHWPGGLGISMVLAMAFFAAFCGSILAAITATAQTWIAQWHGGDFAFSMSLWIGTVAVVLALLAWLGPEARGVEFAARESTH